MIIEAGTAWTMNRLAEWGTWNGSHLISQGAKKARISPANNSGSSNAAKCPPRKDLIIASVWILFEIINVS
ncbi:hypothetical protein [Paenibacillus hexagrammi]|uniref:Uncharacterized protein n=1 Tax=Paenibacillus hexagrammi TaxID=2908839 RepID=A0ABY3SE41_9BACL|nr:hypothetical protein [Paenibacillus sp. YPD9-1]UJF31456.1 hypothetical protein L0M14_16675 [Paenibacillus sp. YPD9-1]